MNHCFIFCCKTWKHSNYISCSPNCSWFFFITRFLFEFFYYNFFSRYLFSIFDGMFVNLLFTIIFFSHSLFIIILFIYFVFGLSLFQSMTLVRTTISSITDIEKFFFNFNRNSSISQKFYCPQLIWPVKMKFRQIVHFICSWSVFHSFYFHKFKLFWTFSFTHF